MTIGGVLAVLTADTLPAILSLLADSSGEGDSTIAAVLFFFVGLYLVYDGFGKWKTKRLVEDTPTEKVRSMAAGRTEVEGVAKPQEKTLPAPFTDEECLYVTWEVEEYQETDDDHDWVTIAQDSRAVPFYLDDGTGRALIRADQGDPTFELSDEFRTRIDVGYGDTTPQAVQAFIEAYEDQQDTSLTENPLGAITDAVESSQLGGYADEQRRYTQTILPPEADVYVLGSATPRTDTGSTQASEQDLELTRDPDFDTFLISDYTEDELESHYERWGPLEILGGIALSAVCLAALLGAF